MFRSITFIFCIAVLVLRWFNSARVSRVEAHLTTDMIFGVAGGCPAGHGKFWLTRTTSELKTRIEDSFATNTQIWRWALAQI